MSSFNEIKCYTIESACAKLLESIKKKPINTYEDYTYIIAEIPRNKIGYDIFEIGHIWCDLLQPIMKYRISKNHYLFKYDRIKYILIDWTIEDGIYNFRIYYGDYDYTAHFRSFHK